MLGWFGAVPPTHPGRVGAQRNLTRAAAGWGKRNGSQGRGNWGRGVTPHSDPGKHASGSKSAQAARLLCAAQKVLARFTDLQAMCAGGCRGEPPCPPRPFRTHSPPTSSPLSHPRTCPDQRPAVRLVKTPPQGSPQPYSPTGPPGQKAPQGPPGQNALLAKTPSKALLNRPSSTSCLYSCSTSPCGVLTPSRAHWSSSVLT